MRGAGPVIKIQEDEKLNSDRPAEIPNSPEQIATPTSLRSHRILPVIKIPWGDPKGAPGETRPSWNLSGAVFKTGRGEFKSEQSASRDISRRARQNADDRRKKRADPKNYRGEVLKRASLQQKISGRGLQMSALTEFSRGRSHWTNLQVSRKLGTSCNLLEKN